MFKFIETIHFAGMHNAFKVIILLGIALWLILIRYLKAEKAIKKFI